MLIKFICFIFASSNQLNLSQMEIKLSIVVMSHLSDAQQEIEYGITGDANTNQRINFVKWLIIKFNGNLDQDVDADALWTEFLTK